MSESNVLTAREAAAFLKIDIKLMYKLLETKQIPSARVGRIFRIHKDALVNYLLGGNNE